MVARNVRGTCEVKIYFSNAPAETTVKELLQVTSSRWRMSLVACVCASVLLANFPVAGAIIRAVIAKETGYTVVIRNDSQHPLLDARVVGGGVEASFGDIPPGALSSRSMWFERDGVLTLLTTSDGKFHTVEVEGYVTGSLGGSATIYVDENGEFSVHNRHG